MKKMFERTIKNLKKMRTKSFLILVMFTVVTTILIFLYKSPQPHLKTIVSRTHMELKNINSKLQVLEEKKAILDVDSSYLELLGLDDDSGLSNTVSTSNVLNDLSSFKQQHSNANQHVDAKAIMLPIVTAFKRFSDKEKLLIESKLRFFKNFLFIIYDIQLSSSEILKIKKFCNSSCEIKPFKGEKYPSHVSDYKIKAYKPIIIQEVLNEYGKLLWIETPCVFTSNRMETFLDKSLENGILTWPLVQPITQMTHPSMFKYFEAKSDDFNFMHMLDTTHFILFNTKEIHEKLMLPWVKCALKEDCISPIGSNYHGCDLSRRPLFLYAGCHRYEMSSFSIIVSLMFNFDQNKFTLINQNNDQNVLDNNTADNNNNNESGDKIRETSDFIQDSNIFFNKYDKPSKEMYASSQNTAASPK